MDSLRSFHMTGWMQRSECQLTDIFMLHCATTATLVVDKASNVRSVSVGSATIYTLLSMTCGQRLLRFSDESVRISVTKYGAMVELDEFSAVAFVMRDGKNRPENPSQKTIVCKYNTPSDYCGIVFISLFLQK